MNANADVTGGRRYMPPDPLPFVAPNKRLGRWLRQVMLRRLVILLALCCTMSLARAAAYIFPGTLPSGCTGSGPAYTCSGTVTLNSGDTVTINSPKPATINITGDLILNNNPQINSAGTAADLTLIMSGQFRAGPGSLTNANVTARRVDAFSGSATYGGSLTTTVDYVAIKGSSYINGSINAKGYVDTGGGTGVAGSVTSNTSYVAVGNASSVNGSITSSDFTTVGDYAGIGGSIVSGYYVTIGTHTGVGGSITASGSGNIYIYSGSGVSGALTANTGDVTLVSGTSGSYSTVGSISTGGNVYLNWYNRVAGNVTGNWIVGGYYNVIGGSVQSGTWPVYLSGNSTVTGSITSSGSYVDIHSDNNVGGNITAGTYVYMDNNNTVGGDVTASTSVQAGSNNTFLGNVTSTTTMSLGSSSSVAKCARSINGNWLTLMTLWSPSLVHGACCGASPTCSNSCISTFLAPKPPACSTFDHLAIQHASGTGLTCTPSTVTIVACADAACSSYYTGGVSGTLTASGSGMTVNYPSGAGFTIPSGSSSTTVSFQVTKAGSVVLGASGLTPSASSSTTCNFGSPSCTFTAADSGLLFNVPDHVSNVVQTVNVSAVKKSDNSLACTPAFASVTKSVNFSCAYSNPTTGTLPVIVGGAALNAGNNSAAACDGNAQAVSLNFNASGVASTSVQYADVGQLTLNASLTGSGTSAGLTMTGTDSFIAAPASFAFSNITAAPIKAGAAFAATVTAKNNSGNTTPNFGRETSAESVRLTWAKYQPTGAGAVAGTFSGSGVSPSAALGGFSNGAATASNLSWTEVGTGDLTATLTSGSYLGSGLTATGNTGTTGAVGRFIPDHFDTVISAQACGTFTYSGQPFTVQILARNATGNTTVNYDGSANTSPNFAKATTLSAASNASTGSLSGGSVALSSFSAGSATLTNVPVFTFTSKLTPATSVLIRATDSDGVSSGSPTVPTEASVALRSGRLRLSNAYGSEKAALQVPLQLQYWSGKSWVLNSADTCTASRLLTNTFALTASGVSTSASSVSLSGGNGNLTLVKPTPVATGYVDVAANLGASGVDQSCLGSHGGSAAGLAWLRSQNGNCAATYDRDPSARATFGIYSPETRRTLDVRESF